MSVKIIDACCFAGDSLYGNSVSIDSLLKDLDKFGIEKAVVRPFKPCDYIYDKANKELANAVSGHSDRLIGFGRVNPLEKNAADQVESMVEYGLTGLHLHPWEDNFIISDPRVYPVIDVCQKHNLPVYVSTGYMCVSEPFQLWELAKRYGDVRFIATHGGQLDISGMSFDDALYAASHQHNIYFDLSGVYRRDFIEKLIKAAGEDHVLYGSCTPYMEFYLEIERIKAAQIPDEQKELLFHGNIEAILGL